MKIVDNFHYPGTGGICFGRTLSTAYSNGTFWTAVQMEKKGRTTIAVLRKNRKNRPPVIFAPTGFCHQPYIVADCNTGVTVIWNEVKKNTWKVKCASLTEESDRFENIETIFSSKGLCFPPTGTYFKNELWAAWPCIEGNNIRINLARKSKDRWQVLKPVSQRGIDAFRPCLASDGDRIFLVWDQYNNKRYEIAFTYFSGSKRAGTRTLSQNNERWFCPRMVVSAGGTAYITWVVMKEVSDSLGIVDHFPFAMAACFSKNKLEYLPDRKNDVDNRIVADLREGLLASERYKGYHGLRRNPYLTICGDEELWCLWEVRIESEGSHISGHLAGRKLKDDKTWTSPVILHSRRHGYSVPAYCPGDRIPAAFFEFGKRGLDIIGAGSMNRKGAVTRSTSSSKWKRWKSISIEPQYKPEKKIKDGSKKYSLFWADTHCHSNVSADAEGEVDELIHFGTELSFITLPELLMSHVRRENSRTPFL